MRHSARLTSDSTLGDLTLQDFQVSPTTPGYVVAHQFEQRPELTGAIVATDSQMLGMISRRRFHEQLSEPYGPETFLKRPIQTFLESSKHKGECLLLPDTAKIDPAVRIALNRPPEDIYEPIIVVFKDPNLPEFSAYFLLDFQALLLAQSQILAIFNRELQQQRLETKRYLIKLEREQHKVEAYTQLLEDQLAIIHERNQLLETKQNELVERSQEITQLNEQFMQIGQLLSIEGKKAFQATFAGVNAICHDTDQVVNTGRLLSEELDTIHETSKLIERVSQQVRYLAVQSAIVANNAGAELKGFSQITTEIGKLVSQTFEAGQYMERITNRIRQRIHQFTASAQAGTKVARSLIEQIEQAQKALAELEALVQAQALDRALPLPTSLKKNIQPSKLKVANPEAVSEATKTLLIKKIELAEASLSELGELIKHKDAGFLIQKIKRTLKSSKKPFIKQDNQEMVN